MQLKSNFQFVLLILFTFALSSCGGGSSDSGARQVKSPGGNSDSPREPDQPCEPHFSYTRTKTLFSGVRTPAALAVESPGGKYILIAHSRSGGSRDNRIYQPDGSWVEIDPADHGAFTRDETQLVTLDREMGDHNLIKVWNPKTGEKLREMELAKKTWVKDLHLSKDAKRTIVVFSDGTIQVVGTQTGTLLSSFSVGRGNGLSTDYDPSTDLMAIGGTERGKVTLWNVTSGQLVSTLPTFPFVVTLPDGTTFYGGGIVRSVQFSGDGKQLVMTCDHTTRIWNFAEGRTTYESINQREVLSASLSGDQKTLYIGEYGSNGRLIDVESGKTLQLLDHPERSYGGNQFGNYCGVGPGHFSSDGKHLVTTLSSVTGPTTWVCAGVFLWELQSVCRSDLHVE